MHQSYDNKVIILKLKTGENIAAQCKAFKDGVYTVNYPIIVDVITDAGQSYLSLFEWIPVALTETREYDIKECDIMTSSNASGRMTKTYNTFIAKIMREEKSKSFVEDSDEPYEEEEDQFEKSIDLLRKQGRKYH